MNKALKIPVRIDTPVMDEQSISEFPLDLLNEWMEFAQQNNLLDFNAMALSTVDAENKPSSRMVLLKQVTKKGLVFFTNYQSRKSDQISANKHVAAVIYWPAFERQVRIEGIVEKLDDAASDEYFDSRPDGSKIGAWASPQSQPIPNRNYLENLKSDFEEAMKDMPVKRPDFWGGYIIKPTLIEFWKGREDRLHDRFEYKKNAETWTVQRLAP